LQLRCTRGVLRKKGEKKKGEGKNEESKGKFWLGEAIALLIQGCRKTVRKKLLFGQKLFIKSYKI